MQMMGQRGGSDPGIGDGVAAQLMLSAQLFEQHPLLAQYRQSHIGRIQHWIFEGADAMSTPVQSSGSGWCVPSRLAIWP